MKKKLKNRSSLLEGYLQAELIGPPAQLVTRILYDSRQYSAGNGALFFAISGKHHNGHEYIEELIAKGVKAFVVEVLPAKDYPAISFYKVPNTLLALQNLAQQIRLHSSAEIIAITGSNGKTVVKEWLSQVLQPHFKLTKNPKSYNSQIGVPISLWNLNADDELGIFEAGISEPDEMESLAQMLAPKWGIFTNIGSAHAENFSNIEAKIDEKLKLFQKAEHLIYQADGSLLARKIESFATGKTLQLHAWSWQKAGADFQFNLIDTQPNSAQVALDWQGKNHSLSLPFGDEASLQNAAHSIVCAFLLGLNLEQINTALAKLNPVEMRLEMKEGIQNGLLINDAYNSDLESLRLALHFLNSHAGERGRVLILSDLQQIGLAPDDLYKALSEIIERFQLESLILIGEALESLEFKTPQICAYYPTTDAFLINMHLHSFKEKAVLLKGARSFAFEKIAERLVMHRHETVLEVHLNRVVHNLNYYRSKLKPEAKLMAMVKAFAYGSGAVEVARVLAFHGVDYLAVAYADEGLELRKAGIELPIMVLNTESSALKSMIKNKLEPEIYSLARLGELVDLLEASPAEEKVLIHLKLETGMHRLGFDEADLDELLQVLQQHSNIAVASVFSHLAAADDPAESDFTRLQIATFKRMSDKIASRLSYPFLRHIANSSGIERFPEAYFDMVRLGIGLYGVSNVEEERKHLLPISELKARVSQIKNLKAGDSVGYGRRFKADAKSRIAVISIGYADGFSRSLSLGVGKVMIKGKLYPTVGSVCMDMVMVNIFEDPIEEGEEVLIFGAERSIYDFARDMNTIPYEVLTGISQRVKRVYFMS
ncbi:MAG: bifunctional UDP-N-acetylmuramoyl-tripeptide:D-alanyl-D-alanine ligase/alanine racemase [Bacteroidetes bacterium]|nr:MAG: bifunctional UDP-N-acetylmuramoyl-tripeptide:D-alanyl-D-alanine ligase/alanine racemase [Bacteroidota bacterium]